MSKAPKTIEITERDYLTEIEEIQKTFGKRPFRIVRPITEFPELTVTIPDNWDSVQLAPLYDVHIGSREFDEKMFLRHRDWIADTPNVLTWNGGDMFENIVDMKMGHTKLSNDEQILTATEMLAPVQHKMLFSLPGNHEERTGNVSGVSSAQVLANNLQVPYFSDYCFAQLKWRGNRFRLVAHHGAGGAQTPGAQRNSARKELTWARADLLWTGHLHQPMVDIIYQIEYAADGSAYERNTVAIISPSYLRYFGGYAAKKRLGPGTRGLSVAVLQEDGQIEVNVHARGKRL
jgi:calcineurin-like phosphoesterase family protein